MIDTARYLGVAPWDLAGVPETAGHPAWVYWGMTHQAAIAAVREHYRKHPPLRR